MELLEKVSNDRENIEVLLDWLNRGQQRRTTAYYVWDASSKSYRLIFLRSMQPNEDAIPSEYVVLHRFRKLLDANKWEEVGDWETILKDGKPYRHKCSQISYRVMVVCTAGIWRIKFSAMAALCDEHVQASVSSVITYCPYCGRKLGEARYELSDEELDRIAGYVGLAEDASSVGSSILKLCDAYRILRNKT